MARHEISIRRQDVRVYPMGHSPVEESVQSLQTRPGQKWRFDQEEHVSLMRGADGGQVEEPEIADVENHRGRFPQFPPIPRNATSVPAKLPRPRPHHGTPEEPCPIENQR